MARDGLILRISRYAIHDGPGIRTTVFLKGCPGGCLWCCNPESKSFTPEIGYKTDMCSDCGACVGVCGSSDECTACGKCVSVCPCGALELYGRTMSTQELLGTIRRDEPFWRRSGGGVTLSGGEALAQAEFAAEFLGLCQYAHIHTAIETCLFSPPEALVRVAEHVDFFIFDIKAIDRDLHYRLTSLDNRCILDNARYILSGEYAALVRYPMIPGYNDSNQEIDAIGRFVSSCRAGASIEILPYHSMGIGKYSEVGLPYSLKNVCAPSAEQLEEGARILRGYGLNVI